MTKPTKGKDQSLGKQRAQNMHATHRKGKGVEHFLKIG
jgi:hypothetical protein